MVDGVAYGPEHGRQLLDMQGSMESTVVISSSSVYRDAQAETLTSPPRPASRSCSPPQPNARPRSRPVGNLFDAQGRARAHVAGRSKGSGHTREAGGYQRPGSGRARGQWFAKQVLDGRPAMQWA